ncbi:MAG: hypothetical protein M0Z39_01420 [Actinomycetota bacterium]|jgi:hypothetical protein|nr:hypothetical protein [Actinomycetota bacterium]
MNLSKEQQTRLRKLVPLVVLYPLSTGVGVVATIYVSRVINHSYPISNTTATNPAGATTTTNQTPTTFSPLQQQEQQRVSDLKSQIAELRAQIQELVGATAFAGSGAPNINSPSTARTQAPSTPAQSPPSAPRRVVTAPPPTHGSTGASRALG